MNPATPKGDGDNLEAGDCHRDNHRNYYSGVALKITLLFAVVGTTCLFLFRSTHPFEFFSNLPHNLTISSSPSCDNHHTAAASSIPPVKPENNKLERTLRKAVMRDKRTVIITTLNAAWTEPNSTLDLFLESFRVGNGTAHLLNHVAFGAFDRVAYDRCLGAGLHCFAIITDGVDFSGEQAYMKGAYLKMMWRRMEVLITALELGFDFIFTDLDVMWLRDPFERLYPESEADLQIACDAYRSRYINGSNGANGGLVHARSNNRTIQFYKYWYAGRQYYPGKHDQEVFNIIQFNPIIPEMGMKIRFLDSNYFGGFCWSYDEQLERVITMHATCCVGQVAKMNALKMVIHDWKRYVSYPAYLRNYTIRSWTDSNICH